MANARVDGMDVMKVHEAARKAINLVRTSSEPFLLEVDTYRYRGHSMGDPERYRTQEEVREWQASDPIGIFRAHLIQKKIATATDLDEVDSKVDDEVQKAVEFAESSPEPAPEALWENIYVDN